MARIGKIARLPQFVRNQLNRRIEDGEPGRPVVEWLNAHPAVLEVVGCQFGGRAITEQNLSEWRQGGFKDWQRHQVTRALARDFLAEAEELEEEIGYTPMPDRLTETVALTLARLLREAVEGEKGPQQRVAILEIAREIARLRDGDRQMERFRREEEIRDEEWASKDKAELQAMEEGIRKEKCGTRFFGNHLRQEYCDEMKAGTLGSERAAELRTHFATHAEWLRECGVKDLPASESEPPGPPAESK